MAGHWYVDNVLVDIVEIVNNTSIEKHVVDSTLMRFWSFWRKSIVYLLWGYCGKPLIKFNKLGDKSPDTWMLMIVVWYLKLISIAHWANLIFDLIYLIDFIIFLFCLGQGQDTFFFWYPHWFLYYCFTLLSFM